MEFSNGIHHVTLITRDVQANVDFYVGFLGLHLVKRTGGYEDGQQLHLFYGDQEGAPGSLVTFLVWQDGAPGRAGLGQVSEIAFAVPAQSIGNWLVRALDKGVPVQGPLREFGEPVLRLKDPDGFIVKLVGVAEGGSENAAGRLRAVTISPAMPKRQPPSCAVSAMCRGRSKKTSSACCPRTMRSMCAMPQVTCPACRAPAPPTMSPSAPPT